MFLHFLTEPTSFPSTVQRATLDPGPLCSRGWKEGCIVVDKSLPSGWVAHPLALSGDT